MQLQKVQCENDVLSEKLNNLETKLENELEESMSIDEELATDVETSSNCDECSEEFGNVGKLRIHKEKKHGVQVQILSLQQRLLMLGKQISDQKLVIAKKISKLKETEFIEKQTCRCTGWCRINHQKHN